MELHQKSILLVDDDPTLLEMYQDRLKAEGFLVSIAKDGEACLRQAEEIKPNLILLDILMPKINGLEVLGRLKDNEATKDIPVVVMTVLLGDVTKHNEVLKKSEGYIVKADKMPQEVIEIIKKTLEMGEKTQSSKLKT
jgi:CheY-like chemotaxis protein